MSDLDNYLLSEEVGNLSMEDVYKAVMYSSPDAIGITDLEGNIVAVSCSALELLHLSSNKKILGKNMMDLLPSEETEFARERLSTLISGRKSERIQLTILRPDQTRFFADVRGDLVRNQHGAPTNFILIVRDITESIEKDENLAIQNSRLSAILKAIPDIIFVLDRQGNYLEVMASNPSQLIIDQNEIVGRNIAEFFNKKETDNHLRNISQCIETQKLINYEYTLQENETTTSWEARLTPMSDDRVLCFVRNITDKKENEEEILSLNTNLEEKIEERTEQLAALNRTLIDEISTREEATRMLEQNNLNFQTFFNAVDDYLFVLDMNHKIIHVNKTTLDRLGYVQKELIGADFKKIHFEDRIPGVECCIEEIITGNIDRCNVPLVTKNKEYIPIETNVKKGTWNGKPVIFVAAKDITDLKFSEEKFAKAFQTNAALIAIIDISTQKVIDFNASFGKRLGYKREALIGKNIAELHINDDYALQKEIIADIKENGSCRDYEVELTTSEGINVPVLFSADVIFIGRQKCIIITMIDISERKQFETEILKNKIEAEKANLAKSEFLSRMSHELRTPLNSILGFAQLMEMTELNETQKKGINHILDSGKHLLDLINEVLDIAKIEAGKYDIHSVPVQLDLIIHELADSIQPLADKNDISIEIEDLTKEKVMADNKFVRQIFLNLLSNAVKYNKRGGFVWITSRIIDKDAGKERMCQVLIKDSGIGIPEDKLDRVFTPFERLGAEKKTIEGTGLGLAVVEKLVHAMHGTIGLTSVLDEGTTFWIELPLAE